MPGMTVTSPDALMAHASDLVTTALPGVFAIYVFGSRASGQQTPESDLDLAILGGEPVAPARLYDIARGLEVVLGTDIDLIDLLVASTVLKKEVIENGRLILCVDRDATLDFEARTLSEYGRYREGIEPLLKAVRETGQAYAP
jgi:predicted nucleotidyltransferase